MGGFNEYERYDGLGLADLVKRGEVSAAEVVEAAIVRIERLNPKLNAVVHPMFEVGRERARMGLEGPFQGVPLLLKDLTETYAGAPTTAGARIHRNRVETADSEQVRRFKQAGVVVLGKTNTPEFGLMGVTEPELFGPCRNPWDTDRTPGGSSGGSAAAVASGMVPIASAGDGGGSIRIPASHCGLFGIKPSRGRTPAGPGRVQHWQGAVVSHVLSRSVRDSAAMLDSLHGVSPGAPRMITPPERPYLEEVSRSPGKLRIAFSTASPVQKEVHPEAVRAVERTIQILTDLGHHVEEAQPAVDGKALALSYITMYCGEIATDLRELAAEHGKAAVAAGVELTTQILGLIGSAISAGEFVQATRQWERATLAMGSLFETYDLYLTPTVARPPVRIGELAPKPAERAAMSLMNNLGAGRLLKAAGLLEKIALDNLAATPFTQLANLTGLPAMSVPLHWTEENLPLGAQFVAPFGDEAVLFRLAGQLEQASPWFDRRPALNG